MQEQSTQLPNFGFPWQGLILFGMPNCPGCDQASRYLQDRNLNFRKVRIDDAPGLAQWIVERTGQRSAPIFFYNGLYVRGGWERARSLIENGTIR